MDIPDYAISVSSTQWVVTYISGVTRTYPRRSTSFSSVGANPSEVFVLCGNRTTTLVWRNETALGATSRQDFLLKLLSLAATVPLAYTDASIVASGLTRTVLAQPIALTTSFSDASSHAFVWPTVPVAVALEGFNANDTAAGNGLRSALVEGLDSNYNEVSEVLTTNGVGVGTYSTQTFLRINGGRSLTTGSNLGGNYNSVYIRDSAVNRYKWIGRYWAGSSTGANFGIGAALNFQYTVPAGYTAYITSITCIPNSGSNPTDWVLWSSDAPTAGPARVLVRAINDFAGLQENKFPLPLRVPEKTDLWLRARCVFATANCKMDLFLVPN